jgi:aerobic-type carbon monoxide dehydrogenase small subunit (CoxS/CutS family)
MSPARLRRQQARPTAAPATVEVALVVNGEPWGGHVPPGEMLLQTLRTRCQLTGAKPACERGECGACTVLVNGRPRMSCITPVLTDGGAEVRTAEGLAQEACAVREAMADTAGFQCGYCTPGQIVAAMALLAETAAPDEAEVRRSMAGNICRCTGYTPIVDAILRAAEHGGGAARQEGSA